ncbi:MAG: hypothetical protein CMJ49_13065 [Planctomycetaceae bacterium]|nr:hypothetical protein [Planctomycetaceae bacterium]
MDATTWLQLGVSFLWFNAVWLLVWSLFRTEFRAEMPITRRVAAAVGVAERRTLFEIPVLGQLMGLAVMIMRRFGLFRSTIRGNLEASGNPNGYTVDEYLAICLSCAVGTAGAVTLLLVLSASRPVGAMLVLAALVVGFAVPIWSLRSTAGSRVRRIARKLPYALDLIALMMQSGTTFTEAIETVIRDDTNEDLNVELQLVQAEIGMGATRATALTNLAERIPLDSLRSVVGAINQSESLGTPLAMILQSQANMLRMRRSVMAEEASAKASLRILVPSMLILFAVVIVVLGPLILRGIEGRLLD